MEKLDFLIESKSVIERKIRYLHIQYKTSYLGTKRHKQGQNLEKIARNYVHNLRGLVSSRYLQSLQQMKIPLHAYSYVHTSSLHNVTYVCNSVFDFAKSS
jgi:hypothetical protein